MSTASATPASLMSLPPLTTALAVEAQERYHIAMPRRISARSRARFAVLFVVVAFGTGACAVATRAEPSADGAATLAAAPTQDGSNGSFRVECELAVRAQVDPIVAPGTTSAHMHDFFGNASTSAFSTYASMRAWPSNCTDARDTAGYWSPTLVAPDGSHVEPERAIFYYRNRPYDYGVTVAFPPDFRMVAGGVSPDSYWTCDGESDTGYTDRKYDIPNCGPGGKIKLHVFFPPCWDGVNLDSADHRSHVAYGLDEDDFAVDGTDPDLCPASHPIKVPQLDFRVQYDVADGTGYRISDGMTLVHADFWNTWDQLRLEELVGRCLGPVGVSCGQIED
jgi:Domain of unknown function (DUF1996)